MGFFRVPAESLLMRKGKRWPEALQREPNVLRSTTAIWDDASHLRNRRSTSSNKVDLFSVRHVNHAVKENPTRNSNEPHVSSNSVFSQFPLDHIRHPQLHSHRHKNRRRRIILNDQSIFVDNPESNNERNESQEILKETNFQENDPILTPTPNEKNRAGTTHTEKKPITEDNFNQPPVSKRQCLRNSFEDTNNNCTERYHFPSAVLMIEAHYNQTVRDFLQICTPVERVEIDSLNDVQVLLNVIYQQMSMIDKGISEPSSVILLFNLENYSNWTKERVIDVLQTTVNVLYNDFSDMMIYSKFHQDGTDSNEIRLLQLIFDIKYWLSDLCNQRLIPCADFSSIILESVLQMNELSESNVTASSASFGTSDETSTQANTYKYKIKHFNLD